jgi:hypothetical protein
MNKDDKDLLVDQVLEWWEEHRYDVEQTMDDEYNVWDEPPLFVETAKRFRNQKVTHEDMERIPILKERYYDMMREKFLVQFEELSGRTQSMAVLGLILMGLEEYEKGMRFKEYSEIMKVKGGD